MFLYCRHTHWKLFFSKKKRLSCCTVFLLLGGFKSLQFVIFPLGFVKVRILQTLLWVVCFVRQALQNQPFRICEKGENRGEREEKVVVVVVVGWCCVVFVCCATNFHFGCVHNPNSLSVHFCKLGKCTHTHTHTHTTFFVGLTLRQFFSASQ